MDFIKKLISGILGFFAGLLPPKKKSNGYFLELEEATSQSKPAASNGKKAQEPVAVAAPAAAKATKVANKTKVEASQNGKAAKAESAKTAATTKTPTETTFAPKYLAPSTTNSNGRRLPGANMSAYLDMARQVKTPK